MSADLSPLAACRYPCPLHAHTHIPLFYAAGVGLSSPARQLAYEPKRKEKMTSLGVVMKGSLRKAQPCICWYVFPSDESDCVAGHVVAKAAQSVCDIQFT